jgi:hypothetical protein
VVFVGTFKAGKQLTAIEDGKLVILPGTLFALADVVIEYGACACLLHPLTAAIWHFRDIAPSWIDFRFRGKNGHAADITGTTEFDPKRSFGEFARARRFARWLPEFAWHRRCHPLSDSPAIPRSAPDGEAMPTWCSFTPSRRRRNLSPTDSA